MRKVFDVRAFQAGYFLLAALSFNSLTAGRRFMSLLTALVLTKYLLNLAADMNITSPKLYGVRERKAE